MDMEMEKLYELAMEYTNAKGKYHYWQHVISSFKQNSADVENDKTYNYVLSCYNHSFRNAEFNLNQLSKKLQTALVNLPRFCGKYSNTTRQDLFNEVLAKNLVQVFYSGELENEPEREITEYLLFHNDDLELYLYKIRTDRYYHETTSIIEWNKTQA